MIWIQTTHVYKSQVHIGELNCSQISRLCFDAYAFLDVFFCCWLLLEMSRVSTNSEHSKVCRAVKQAKEGNDGGRDITFGPTIVRAPAEGLKTDLGFVSQRRPEFYCHECEGTIDGGKFWCYGGR